MIFDLFSNIHVCKVNEYFIKQFRIPIQTALFNQIHSVRQNYGILEVHILTMKIWYVKVSIITNIKYF